MTDAKMSWGSLPYLILLAVLPYLNTLKAGFTLDDEPVIVTNPIVTNGVDVWGALSTPLFPGDLFRPLTVLTFAVNQALTPDDPALFHAVNVALHAVVTVLVFWLAMRLFGSVRVAVTAGALFAVHPIHTEAVSSLVGRAEVLAALFGLIALLAAAPSGEIAWPPTRVRLLTSLVCFSLALMSKESSLMLLALIPLFRIAIRGAPLNTGLRDEIVGLHWAPYVLCAGAILLLRYHVVGKLHVDTVTPLDNVLAFVPSGVRVRSALGVFWDYFGLLNVPLILAADYSYAQVPIVTSWTEPRFLAGTALLLGAILAACLSRRPALTFAFLSPFVALSLTANMLFPIGTPKAERLLYFPSVGWALLIAYALDRCIHVTRLRTAAVAALSIVIAGFAVRTWERNWDWQDNLTLYRSMARTAPRSAKARYNLGVALQKEGTYLAAAAQFQEALAIYPQAEGAALGIGYAFERTGRVDKAIEWYERALTIAPWFGDAHTNLCHVLFSNDRYSEAVVACRKGLRYRPTDANLLKGLGGSLAGIGETEKAVQVLRRSLRLNERDNELKIYLAKLEAVNNRPIGQGATLQ